MSPCRATALLLMLGTAPLAAQDATTRLGWLAGCWESRTGQRVTLEMWSPPAGGLMVGGSRTVTAGTARSFEHLRLRAVGDTLVYTALPSGQQETSFRSTTVTDTSFTVENPAHDFPTRISYTLTRPDSVIARVEGPAPDGGMRGFGISYARGSCTGT
jgi:hypothetical protein